MLYYHRIVVQLAKAEGLKVIGSSGSDEKAALVSSLGADVSYNYKTVKQEKVLENEGPINMFVLLFSKCQNSDPCSLTATGITLGAQPSRPLSKPPHRTLVLS